MASAESIVGQLVNHESGLAQHDQLATPAAQPSQGNAEGIVAGLVNNNGQPPASASTAPAQPKNYLPGRAFGMDVAKGMGLDAERIKSAEDTDGMEGALKELGGQVLEGLKGTLKDPFNIVKGPSGNFEEALKSGSPGQIVGALSSILGGAEGAEKTGEMAGKARANIGEAIDDPEGELTGGASAVCRAAGGAAGYTLGPSLMERMFPEPEAKTAARTLFKNTKEVTEAHESALKEAETRAEDERVTTERAAKAEKSAREEALAARDKHAEDLMQRQREQDKLDAADIRATNAAARAKRDALEARDQTGEDLMKRQKQQDALDRDAAKAQKEAQESRDRHAQDLMDRQKQQDSLDAMHQRALKNLETARQKELAQNERFKQQHAESLNRRGDTETESPAGGESPKAPDAPGSPQDLINRPKKLVIPGEKPSSADLKRAGDMTQVELPRLKLLANFGDELAKNELIRRQRH